MNLKNQILSVTSFCLLVIGLITLNSCDADILSKDEEGIIEFETKAVDETHPLYGFAPNSATLKFKENKFMIEMSTMGMFNTSIIGDSKEKTLAQTVKFMNIKQACIEHEADLIEDNKEFELKIEETGETKDIIGLKAYKVKVSKIKEPDVKFDVWYTKELGMKDCNALTPYAQVKGVLLDYRIKKMGMEMHFLAKSYKHIEIIDKEFDIPASMKIVSKEKMMEFFNGLQ